MSPLESRALTFRSRGTPHILSTPPDKIWSSDSLSPSAPVSTWPSTSDQPVGQAFSLSVFVAMTATREGGASRPLVFLSNLWPDSNCHGFAGDVTSFAGRDFRWCH